jgi:D-glycero-alpha-D-manno-heptose-7-phosphate kinase
MIISRTPLRVSFVGGGTDLPAFYCEEPGAVISVAINKYIYINVNKKFDHKIRASYSITEMVDNVRELKHELIREAMQMVGVESGVEITSISDVHSYGTGLGSSSTYTVGLLNALYAYYGRHVGAERLAQEAARIEIELCGKPIGKQDQYIAAYGGMQYIQFNPDGTVFTDPILCKPETRRTLQSRLMMLYTGITRSADSILQEQKSNTESDGSRRETLRRMTQMARDLRFALGENDLDAFGGILHDSWLLKRGLASGISNAQIDAWYDRARRHGAIGGKILGAGGGGFLLLYAPPECHPTIMAALPELEPMPFQFEPQGSKIIFVEEDDRPE